MSDYDLATLKIEVDTTGISRADKELKSLAETTKKFTATQVASQKEEDAYSRAGIKSLAERREKVTALSAAMKQLQTDHAAGIIVGKEYTRMHHDIISAQNLAIHGNSRHRGAIRQTAAAMASLTFEMTGALYGVIAITTALGAPAFFGVKFLRSIEDAKVGIAGTLQAMSNVSGAGQTWSQSMTISETAINKLAAASVKYNVSLEDVTKTFQAIVGQGMAAGMTLEQIGRIATIGTMAVKSMNIESRQAVQEVRDLVQGGIQAASSTVATALGITDAMVKKWKEAGTLFDELEKRMSGYTMAAMERQNTLSGALDILKIKIQRLFSDEGGFKAFKDIINNISNAIGKINYETGQIEFNPELVKTVKSYWDVLEGAARSLGTVLEYSIKFAAVAKDLAGAFVSWKAGIVIWPMIAGGVTAAGAALMTFMALPFWTTVVSLITGIGAAFMNLPVVFASAITTMEVAATRLTTRLSTLSAGAMGGLVGVVLFGVLTSDTFKDMIDLAFNNLEERAQKLYNSLKTMGVDVLKDKLKTAQEIVYNKTPGLFDSGEQRIAAEQISVLQKLIAQKEKDILISDEQQSVQEKIMAGTQASIALQKSATDAKTKDAMAEKFAMERSTILQQKETAMIGLNERVKKLAKATNDAERWEANKTAEDLSLTRKKIEDNYARSFEDIARREKEANKKLNKEEKISSEQQLINTLKERLAVNELDLVQSEKITASEKEAVRWMQQIVDGTYKGTEAQKIATAALYEKNIAKEKGIALDIEFEKTSKSISDLSIKEIADIDSKIIAQQKHNDEIGKSAEQKALAAQATEQLLIKQMELEASATREAANTVDMDQAYKDLYIRRANALDIQIAKRKELAGLEGQAASMEAQNKIIADELKAQEAKWKMIDGFAHDAFDNIFDKGKNVFKELGNAIKKYLLDMLYKMTLQKWVISVTASMGMTGVAQAGQAANTLSGVGDLTSGISNLTSVLGNFGNTVSNFLGITEMAGGMASMAGSTAVMSAAYTAPAIATSTAMGAAAGTGLMTTIGAALPWIGGALAVYSLFKGNGGTPTTSLGHAVTSFGATGQQTGTQSLYGGSSAGVDAQIMSMQTGYMKAAMALGIGTTAQQWGFAMNTGANGQKPMFGLSGGGFSQAETAQSDAAVQLAASRAVFSALQGSDLPQFLSRMFEGLTAGAMTQQDIDNTLAFAGSVKQMRDALLETRTPLEVLRANVDSGTAAFATSAATFRTDFVAAIDAGINPQVFEQWHALGTAIDQLAAADAELAAKAAEDAKLIADNLLEWQNKYAVLMGTTTERAIQWQTDLASTTDATTQSVINLYYAQLDLNDANDAAIALANQGTELSLRVMELEGAASSALAIRRAIEIDALDASLRPIQQRIWALEDEAVATDAAATIAEANAALVIEAENAIYEARRRNLDEAKAHVAAVFSALQLAVDTQRQALTSAYDLAVLGAKTQIDSITKSVGNLRSIADMLKSSIEALLPMSRAQAQAFIRASISAGGVGDSAKLKQSLEAISKPSEGLFGNFIDYQRDFMRTANDISTLSGITDIQLTAEERLLTIAENQLKIIEDDYQVQMSILDGVILSAQGQIDAINGTTVAVMSIEAAMSGLASAIAAQSVAQAAVTAIPPPSTSFTPTVTPATMSIDEAYQSILGRAPAPAGREFWTNAFGDTIDRTELAQFLQGAQPELAAISSGTQDEWLHSMGVPGYATGGIHEGGWRIVGENGPEIEYTPPSRIFSNSQSRGMMSAANDDTANEIKNLRAELQAIGLALAKNTGEAAKILRKFDGDGMPAERVVAA